MNIWVYWEGPCAPYIKLCMETIRKYAGGLKVIMLNDKLVKNYLSLPKVYPKLSVVHRADYVRVALLQKYGGMWLDADTIVLRPLTKCTSFLNKYKFIGFGKVKAPQTAIIASVPNSLIISLWSRRINLKINSKHISWGDLGPIALERILLDLRFMNRLEYHNIPANYCVPIPCKCWPQFYSTRLVLSDVLSDKTGMVMLYNKIMKHKLNAMNRDNLIKSDMLISKLFRKAIYE